MKKKCYALGLFLFSVLLMIMSQYYTSLHFRNNLSDLNIWEPIIRFVQWDHYWLITVIANLICGALYTITGIILFDSDGGMIALGFMTGFGGFDAAVVYALTAGPPSFPGAVQLGCMAMILMAAGIVVGALLDG